MANTQMERCPQPCNCKTSTGICGSITRGTGKLSFNGYWEFPCTHGNAYSDYEPSTPAAPETAPDSDSCEECGGTDYHDAACTKGQELADAIQALRDCQPKPDLPTKDDLKVETLRKEEA